MRASRDKSQWNVGYFSTISIPQTTMTNQALGNTDYITSKEIWEQSSWHIFCVGFFLQNE